jgi:hypothetical protein
MTIHDLPTQYGRLLNHLRDHGPASTKEIENNCAIMHPSTIVSRIRAIYGDDTITGQWRTGRNSFGEKTRFMMYTLTKEGPGESVAYTQSMAFNNNSKQTDMTRTDLAKEILATVENLRARSLDNTVIIEDIRSLLSQLEPKDRERFAKWGYPNQQSTPDECWK